MTHLLCNSVKECTIVLLSKGKIISSLSINLVAMMLLIAISSCENEPPREEPPDLYVHEDFQDFNLEITLDAPTDTTTIVINQENLFTAKRSQTIYHVTNKQDTTIRIPVFKPQELGVLINGHFSRVLALPNGKSSIKYLTRSEHKDSSIIHLENNIDKYLSGKTRSLWESSDGPWERQMSRLQKKYNSNIEFLKTHSDSLPNWYFNYESENLKLDFWENMYATYSYRKAMLDLDDPMPRSLAIFLDTLSLNQNGPWLRTNYLTLSFAKRARLQTTGDRWFKEFSAEDRYQYIIDYLNDTSAITDQMLAIKLYLNMSRSSREFSDALKRQTLNKINQKYSTLLNSHLNLQESLLQKNAPGFVLETQAGDLMNLDEFKGKPIYMSFWFTGCLPCIKAFPAENKLIEKLEDSEMQFIRICTNSRREDWLEMVNEYNLKSLNLYADKNWSDLMTTRYNLNVYPKYLLVDSFGIIVEDKGLSPKNENILEKLSKVL